MNKRVQVQDRHEHGGLPDTVRKKIEESDHRRIEFLCDFHDSASCPLCRAERMAVRLVAK